MDMSFDEIMQAISGGSGDTEADNKMFGAGSMRHQRGPLDASYQNMPGQQTFSGNQYAYNKGPAMDAGMAPSKNQDFMNKALATMGTQGQQKKEEKPPQNPPKYIRSLMNPGTSQQPAVVYDTNVQNSLMPDDDNNFGGF